MDRTQATGRVSGCAVIPLMHRSGTQVDRKAEVKTDDHTVAEHFTALSRRGKKPSGAETSTPSCVSMLRAPGVFGISGKGQRSCNSGPPLIRSSEQILWLRRYDILRGVIPQASSLFVRLGGASFGVPSVACWNSRMQRRSMKEGLDGKGGTS